MMTIPGAPLLGFAQAFDGAYGDPATPKPYPVVTPSKVGPSLLPFACPFCGAVCAGVVDPNRRERYFDHRRKFSWCPSCRKRFYVDRRGAPLAEALGVGAAVAPAIVERRGKGAPLVGAAPAYGVPVRRAIDLIGAL